MPKITTPTVHLNGSSKNILFEQNADAAGALRSALTALQRAAPHGRDYYTQGQEAHNKAIAEHQARVTKVREVLREIETICEAIQDS